MYYIFYTNGTVTNREFVNQRFQQEYLHWCERTLDKYPDNLEWDKTIERLREEKIIDIENEKIYLKELVLGHIK